MPAQDIPVLNSNRTGVLQFMLHRWQALDRGWKAAIFGVIIVFHHLLGVVL